MENNFTEAKSRDHEIDLRFFFTVLRKCWYFVILAAVVFGLLAGVYSSFFIEKRYSSTVNMYVDPNTTASGTINFSTADALAATYPPVLRNSDEFKQQVALEMALAKNEDGEAAFPSWTYRDVGTPGTPELVANDWGRVGGMVTTGIKEDKIFYITIRSTDPHEAYAMAKIAVKVAPDILNDVVGVGRVMVIGYPALDTVPDSPNVLRNVALAAVVGAVLVYVVFFLIRLFDTTVYTEGDLTRFGLPVLGVVPTFPPPETERAVRNAGKEVHPQ